jgi:hypothetical protein
MTRRFLPVIPGLFAFALALPLVGTPALAAPDLDEEDFRVYCGYLDALTDDKVQKLKPKQREERIAKMAKLSPKTLMASVKKGEAVGATCEEIGKQYEESLKKSLAEAMPGRIDLFVLDWDDPSHVLAYVRWKGADKQQLEEEAALLAYSLATVAPIIRTIAVRGVDPTAADRESDEAVWFEAKINRQRASRIEKERIKDFADTRYIRLFDNVVRN